MRCGSRFAKEPLNDQFDAGDNKPFPLLIMPTAFPLAMPPLVVERVNSAHLEAMIRSNCMGRRYEGEIAPDGNHNPVRPLATY